MRPLSRILAPGPMVRGSLGCLVLVAVPDAVSVGYWLARTTLAGDAASADQMVTP